MKRDNNMIGMKLAAVLAAMTLFLAPGSWSGAEAADRPTDAGAATEMNATADALPVPTFARDWKAEGKVRLFDKDNLFDHIDGEAELYMPYGFAGLATVAYLNAANAELSVVADVYRMGSLLDAFGIYSNYRRTDDTTAVTVGAEGFVSSAQLLFYQGRYFVRLSVSGADKLDPEVLTGLARAISRRLPPSAAKPRELDAFALPGVIPKSERYIAKSLLGYAFFRRGIVAEALLSGERVQVFAVIEDSDDAARKTLGEYLAYLGGQKDKGGLTAAVDPLFGQVLIGREGRYLTGAVRMKEAETAKPLVESLRQRLRDSSRP